MTGVNRHRLCRQENKKLTPAQKSRLKAQCEGVQTIASVFMERDDISRVIPNKNDVTKNKTEQNNIGAHQPKRVLNYYIHNVYGKFNLEYPEIKMSLTTFGRCRPKHVLLTNFAVRRSCLCTKHQNMTLKLTSFVNKRGANADSFVKVYNDDLIIDMIDNVEESVIKYETWKRVLVGPENKKKIENCSRGKGKHRIQSHAEGGCENLQNSYWNY